jgi:hypothetical protein
MTLIRLRELLAKVTSFTSNDRESILSLLKT